MFGVILTWLRRRRLLLKTNTSLESVQVEAEYFGLEELKEHVEGLISVKKSKEDKEAKKVEIEEIEKAQEKREKAQEKAEEKREKAQEKAQEEGEAMWREEVRQKEERKDRKDRDERLDKEERADRWKKGLLEALKEVRTELSAIKKCIQK